MPPKIKQSDQAKAASPGTDPQTETIGSLVTNPQDLADDIANLKYMIQIISGGTFWGEATGISIGSHASQHESGGTDTINHDSLVGFVANEHIDWTSTTSNFLTTGSLTAGAGSLTNLSLSSSLTVGTTLTVTGVSTFNSSLDINSNVEITGDILVEDGVNTYIDINVADELLLRHLPTPTNSDQAVPKSYVDSAVAVVDDFKAGNISLNASDSTKAVSFTTNFSTTDYTPMAIVVYPSGGFVISTSITSKTVSGYTVAFSAPIPAAGYSLEWMAIPHNNP